MERMRTFLLYALGIVGFIFLSYILEDGLIIGTYKQISEVSNPVSSDSINISDVSGRASYVSGYMDFKLTNTSNKSPSEYVKIELFSKQGLQAATKYVQIEDLDPGNTKEYQVKFKANDIKGYRLSIVNQAPDKSNILNLFGFEIDLTNVFGMDLSNATIFGVKLSEIFNFDNLKTAGGNAWSWTVNFLGSIPWWGYVIGGGIVLWFMPLRYLFGIFPI